MGCWVDTSSLLRLNILWGMTQQDFGQPTAVSVNVTLCRVVRTWGSREVRSYQAKESWNLFRETISFSRKSVFPGISYWSFYANSMPHPRLLSHTLKDLTRNSGSPLSCCIGFQSEDLLTYYYCYFIFDNNLLLRYALSVCQICRVNVRFEILTALLLYSRYLLIYTENGGNEFLRIVVNSQSVHGVTFQKTVIFFIEFNLLRRCNDLIMVFNIILHI